MPHYFNVDPKHQIYFAVFMSPHKSLCGDKWGHWCSSQRQLLAAQVIRYGVGTAGVS